MVISKINASGKQVIKVYAARAYTVKAPRTSNYVEVNIPEDLPTVPRDNSTESIGLSGSFFVNNNYPITTGVVKSSHSITLPLLRGTSCPVYFKKDTPFILFTPTSRIEDGYLLYI